MSIALYIAGIIGAWLLLSVATLAAIAAFNPRAAKKYGGTTGALALLWPVGWAVLIGSFFGGVMSGAIVKLHRQSFQTNDALHGRSDMSGVGAPATTSESTVGAAESHSPPGSPNGGPLRHRHDAEQQAPVQDGPGSRSTGASREISSLRNDGSTAIE